jgi:hypothetical protein
MSAFAYYANFVFALHNMPFSPVIFAAILGAIFSFLTVERSRLLIKVAMGFHNLQHL